MNIYDVYLLWIFLDFSFYVRSSIRLQLPPLRFHCVGGCWDRTQDNWRHWLSAPLTTRLDLIHLQRKLHTLFMWVCYKYTGFACFYWKIKCELLLILHTFRIPTFKFIPTVQLGKRHESEHTLPTFRLHERKLESIKQINLLDRKLKIKKYIYSFRWKLTKYNKPQYEYII